MATTTFLGYPPAGIRSWIINNGGQQPTPPTPSPTYSDWTCTIKTIGEKDVGTVAMTYNSEKDFWRGEFQGTDSQTRYVWLKNPSEGIWQIAENDALTPGSWLPMSDVFNPDAVSPLSIGPYPASYEYTFTRTVS